MDRDDGSDRPRDDEHDDGRPPERDEKERGFARWARWARHGVLVLQLLAAGLNAAISLTELINLISQLT
jgi:hypothetical protein